MTRRSPFVAFFVDSVRIAVVGSRGYYTWMGSLAAFMILGAVGYSFQVRHGLSATGLNDYVSWGLYISNFTFLVGVAAASIMLVMPTYIIHDIDFAKAVIIGEGMAVGALLMCLAFVTADMGGPERFWHMIPGIGRFNWPVSMLTWDILVLNGYLALNLGIPFYILYTKYKRKTPNRRLYVPIVILSVFWAVSIHLVTAFLYASQPARPFWNNALLGPRFLASAFCAGPALIIVVLSYIRRYTAYDIADETLRKLSLITTVAAQINLIMLASELFKEFYHRTGHTVHATYLLFGLHGHHALVPWMWTSLVLNGACTTALTIGPLRRNKRVLLVVCICLFVAVWIEKGMGLIVPGFTPSPLGELVDYSPSIPEVMVTVGIWAMGAFVITALVRVAIAIELGTSLYAPRRRFVVRPVFVAQSRYQPKASPIPRVPPGTTSLAEFARRIWPKRGLSRSFTPKKRETDFV